MTLDQKKVCFLARSIALWEVIQAGIEPSLFGYTQRVQESGVLLEVRVGEEGRRIGDVFISFSDPMSAQFRAPEEN